jgi:hypothetical protein
MDGRERQGYVLMDDGAQEYAGGENPHQGPKAQSGPPIYDSETRDEVREHRGNNQALATTNNIAHAGVAAFAAAEGSAPLSSTIAPPKTVYHARLATNAASAAATTLK